ncbi:MAG: hypothetical protein AB7G87_04970 [Clostridia bacterium]
MSILAKYARIITFVIPIIFALVFGGMYLYNLFKKKGLIKKKTKEEKETDLRKVKRLPIENFNVVEDIKDNYIVTDNGTRFTTALSCTGVAFDYLSPLERKVVEDNYIGFYNMLDWSIQLYIQGRLMDVESNLFYLQENLDTITKEYDNMISHRKKLAAIIGDLKETSPARYVSYLEELEETERSIRSLEYQINHKEEEIAYAKAVASPESQPQFDSHIIFSHEYSADDFTTELSPDEIFKKAADSLDTKASNTAGVMKRTMTECEQLTKQQMAEILYRAYNLSDADIVPFKEILKTSAFDLFTTTDYFEESKIRYTAEAIKKDLEQPTNTEVSKSA